MVLWGFGRAELRTIRGTEFCVLRFTLEMGVSCSISPFEVYAIWFLGRLGCLVSP